MTFAVNWDINFVQNFLKHFIIPFSSEICLGIFFLKKLGLNKLVAVHHVKLGFSMKIASISDPPLDGETVAAISVVHRLGR